MTDWGRVENSVKERKKHIKKRIDTLKRLGYITTKIDGVQVMCHPDVIRRHIRNAEIDINDNRIFRLDRIEEYSDKEIRAGEREDRTNKSNKERKPVKMSKAGVIGAIVTGLFIVVCLVMGIICIEKIPVGYEGIVYSMNGGVQETTLTQGWHMINPTQNVKLFTVSNEQLLLTKDKRENSEKDESFKVATSDNASIAISFQMSYRFIPDNIVSTYKSFKMSGEDIVNNRVKTVLKSKVSEITTSYSLMDLYSGDRAAINDKITDYLNEKFSSSYGVEVLDASIIDVHPDKKLQTAIDNRVEAQQKADQAKAEQETTKVEAQTAKIKAQNEADIKILEAKAEADAMIVKAEAEAKANKTIASSITDGLIDMKEAEARLKHGWVEVTGADSVVVSNKEK